MDVAKYFLNDLRVKWLGPELEWHGHLVCPN